MTTLRNTIDQPLCFDFNGKDVHVPPSGEGGKIEVEHKQVRFLLMRRLPLEVVEGTETGDTDEEESDDPELALWMKRAKEAAADARGLIGELHAAEDRAIAAEADLSAARLEIEQLKAELVEVNALLHSATEPAAAAPSAPADHSVEATEIAHVPDAPPGG